MSGRILLDASQGTNQLIKEPLQRRSTRPSTHEETQELVNSFMRVIDNKKAVPMDILRILSHAPSPPTHLPPPPTTEELAQRFAKVFDTYNPLTLQGVDKFPSQAELRARVTLLSAPYPQASLKKEKKDTL